MEQVTAETSLARVVVLLSGSGRTLANLLEHAAPDDRAFDIVRVISTRPGIVGNDVAVGAGLPLSIIARKDYDGIETFSDAVFEVVNRESADLVVCAGFLSKLVVPEEYLGRILNIHPSLLPLFGGKGYYGENVHRAVMDSGMKVSGCTVHFIDNDYDAGPIIAQRCVPVLPDDSADTLACRVFAEECRLYPEVVSDVARGRIWLEDGVVQMHNASV